VIPLGLCAVLATFIIIERVFYYTRIKKKDDLFLDRLLSLINSCRFEEALSWCNSLGTPAAQVSAKAVLLRHMPEHDVRELVEVELDKQLPRLDRFLTALGTIANVSTLLGLLGTVTGNIQAFSVLGGGQSMGNPALLAGSISEALITTAAGLCISIPAVIFHNYFVSIVRKRIATMEAIASSVVIQVCGRNLVGKGL
jgi:biopolymer transport protein ExbB